MNGLTPEEYEQLKRDALEAKHGKALPPPLPSFKATQTISMTSITFLWAVLGMICIVASLFNVFRLIEVQESLRVITLTEAVLSIYYFLVFLFWTYLTTLCFKQGMR